MLVVVVVQRRGVLFVSSGCGLPLQGRSNISCGIHAMVSALHASLAHAVSLQACALARAHFGLDWALHGAAAAAFHQLQLVGLAPVAPVILLWEEDAITGI